MCSKNRLHSLFCVTEQTCHHLAGRRVVLQGVMSPSPSGALGDQQYRQLSMGRMPSMGMGKLESMELPDAVAAVAMLHDMPAEQQRGGGGGNAPGGGSGAAGAGSGGGSPAGAHPEAAKQPPTDGMEPPANGLAGDAQQVREAHALGRLRCCALSVWLPDLRLTTPM